MEKEIINRWPLTTINEYQKKHKYKKTGIIQDSDEEKEGVVKAINDD